MHRKMDALKNWSCPDFGGREKRNLGEENQEDSMGKSQPTYSKEFKQQASPPLRLVEIGTSRSRWPDLSFGTTAVTSSLPIRWRQVDRAEGATAVLQRKNRSATVGRKERKRSPP